MGCTHGYLECLTPFGVFIAINSLMVLPNSLLNQKNPLLN
jgi:hypothetical protein